MNPNDLGPEDPEMLKLHGEAVLQPMEEGKVYSDMAVNDAVGILKSKMIIRLGAENYKLVLLGLQVFAALVVIYVVYRVISIFSSRSDDPVARRLREIEQKEKEREIARKNRKQNEAASDNNTKSEEQQSSNKKAGDDDNQQSKNNNSASGAKSSSPAYNFPMCKRTREPTLSKPTSSRKGFDLVSVCKGSPDANVVVVAERAKRTVSVFAQHKAFVSTFKTSLNVVDPFENDRSGNKPLITACSFSPDSRFFCLYDVAQQSITVVRNDTTENGDHTEFAKSGQATHVYSLRTADATGLAGVPRGKNWGTQFAHFFPVPSPHRLFFFVNDGCLLIHDGNDGSKLASAKKAYGNHVAWGIAADGVAACAGSTMQETHMHHIKIREGHNNSVSVDRFGPALSPSNKRISNVLLSPDAKVIMMLPEDSSTFTISFLYSVDLENGNSPPISVELTDDDFLDPSVRSLLQIEMQHFAPNPTNPDKHATYITFKIGGDFVVYRLDSFEANPEMMPGRKPKQPHVHRVLEVHGAHGNDSSLIGSAIVGRGRGIITATETDAKKSLCCWELNNHA